MNSLRHFSKRSMLTIIRPTTQRMTSVQHRLIHHRLCSPYLRVNEVSMNPSFLASSKRTFSNMHGTHFSTYEWWNRLFFSHWQETKWASSVITISGAWVVSVCAWCLYNSVMRDPEVRLRPHKKAWHVSQERLNNAGLYKGGNN